MLLFKDFHLNVVTTCVTINTLLVALYFSNVNAAPVKALKGVHTAHYTVSEYATLEDYGGSRQIFTQ